MVSNAQRDIRRKRQVLEYAVRIRNIRKTCRHFGIPWLLFYVWRAAFERDGEAGLVNKRRFRDECLNEHWFTSLVHTQVLIEAWRREYNEERPKKGLGGLTSAQYAKRLVAERSTVTIGL